MLKVAVSVVTI